MKPIDNIRFEDWEAEQMRDPEFRAAVKKLEPEYQRERRQMNRIEQATSITGADIDAAIQDERMIELERRIERLERRATDHIGRIVELKQLTDRLVDRQAVSGERIAELKRRVDRIDAEAVGNLSIASIEQGERIERLEAALETWLIAVNYDTAATPPMNEMDVTAGKPVYSAPE